jgi:DHA1 family bicyclomycin/chloramphenicol resistance-like MFS transporter
MTSATQPAGRSRASLAVVLGALSAFGPVSVDMYLPAFPSIAQHFDASIGDVQLTLATFMVGMAVGQFLYGSLSDRYGRRGPLVAGAALYAAASLGCALAPSVGALAALRFVQALGACAGIVVTRAIVRDLFHGAEAARFYSLLVLVFGVSPVVGPLLGSQILALAGWQAIFLVLVGFGLACVLCALWLPETLPAERRRREPLGELASIYRRLVVDRRFSSYALASACSGGVMLAFLVASPAVLIDQYGVSPRTFALIFGASALGLVAASQLTRRLLKRYRLDTVLRRAVLLQFGGAVIVLVAALSGAGGLASLLPPLFLLMAVFGCVMPTSTALALTPFPSVAGSASALLGGFGAIVAAVSGVFVSALDLSPALAMATVMVIFGSLSAAILLLAAPSSTEAALVPVETGAEARPLG